MGLQGSNIKYKCNLTAARTPLECSKISVFFYPITKPNVMQFSAENGENSKS